MPVLAGVEAHAVSVLQPAALSAVDQRAPHCARRQQAAAETGRPETSREFAKRIRRVVLHGPRAKAPVEAVDMDNDAGVVVPAQGP